MARFSTAIKIINQVAGECGLIPENDPYSSTNQAFIQLRFLLDTAGHELNVLHPWQLMVKEFNFTTSVATNPQGEYDLPDDYSYMIDQTGWNRSELLPVAGPFTAQDWAYVTGRDLVSSTIYASFRIWENKLQLFPQPPPNNQNISFQYMGRNWIADTGTVTPVREEVAQGTDVILYEPLLIQRCLKLKYLQAKGFGTATSQADYDLIFRSLTGKDTGATIVNAARSGRNFPYLDTYKNTPDTNFGT